MVRRMNKRGMIWGICLLLACAMLTGSAETHTLIVKANTYPLYDLACALCGDWAIVEYVPEANANTLGACDWLLCQGTAQDAWVETLSETNVLRATDQFELIDGATDVLSIPINLVLYAYEWAESLSAMDAVHRELYQANLFDYASKMIDFDMRIRNTLSADTKVVDENGHVMLYFLMEYGVSVAAPGEVAFVWHTYFNPEEADMGIPYVELLERNLKALHSDGQA